MTRFDYYLAIIIPSWNCEKYISEMLDSILANTFDDYKVFIIDDHSTDKTRDIIKYYQAKDARIILKERNRIPKGASTCRNIGFELSEGAKYVIWFDADDIIAPYCLEQRVCYMERHPELDFGIFPAMCIRENIKEPTLEIFGYRVLDDSLKAMLQRTLPMVGWTNIYKRTSVIKYGLIWDEQILSLQDSDWNVQAIIKGCKYEYAVEEGMQIDYYYKVLNTGIAKNIPNEAHFNSHIYFMTKLVNSLSSEQKKIYSDQIESYYLWIADMMKGSFRDYTKLLFSKWYCLHPISAIKMFFLFFDNFRHVYKLFPNVLYQQDKAFMAWMECREMYISKIKGEEK